MQLAMQNNKGHESVSSQVDDDKYYESQKSLLKADASL